MGDPYESRAIRFLELWEVAGWRLKLYGIRYGGERPAEELVAAARGVIEELLRQTPPGGEDYGVGFACAHQGKTGNFVFVDWWADENELYHHVWVSSGQEPAELDYRTPTGLAACTWDLYLIGFERDAWVETVVRRPDDPDLEGYLARRLVTDQ